MEIKINNRVLNVKNGFELSLLNKDVENFTKEDLIKDGFEGNFISSTSRSIDNTYCYVKKVGVFYHIFYHERLPRDDFVFYKIHSNKIAFMSPCLSIFNSYNNKKAILRQEYNKKIAEITRQMNELEKEYEEKLDELADLSV